MVQTFQPLAKSYGVTMKVTEQLFLLVLLICYEVQLLSLCLKYHDVTDNETEQYFPIVLCIVLYVQGASFLTFESVDEILFCQVLMQTTKKYFHLVQFISQVLTK